MKKLLSIIILSTSLTIIASCGKCKSDQEIATSTITPTIRATESPMSIEEYSYIFSIGAKDAEGIKDCTYEYDKKSKCGNRNIWKRRSSSSIQFRLCN